MLQVSCYSSQREFDHGESNTERKSGVMYVETRQVGVVRRVKGIVAARISFVLCINGERKVYCTEFFTIELHHNRRYTTCM